MSAYFLSIGSNIRPEENIPKCLSSLRSLFPSVVYSSVYETNPVGNISGGKFWNLAARMESSLAREKLREKLRALEEKLGRVRMEGNKFAPRTIDIDILPQQSYQQMAFIMIPLAEIAPQEKDDETGKKFLELAQKFKEEAKTFRKIEAVN